MDPNRTGCQTNPPTAPPSSFLTIPQELRARIVLMAKLQDDAVRKRLQKSQRWIQEDTNHFMGEYTWYGRSVHALYATCRNLRDLARPFVFETLKLSRAADSYFRDSILPNHAHLIQNLVFDDCGNISIFFPFLLVSTSYMTSLKRITFSPSISDDELISWDQKMAHTTPDFATICFRTAITALKPRVKTLSCFDLGSEGIKIALKLWPRVERLSLVVTEDNDLDDLGEAIAALHCLKVLELSTGWPFGALNLSKITGDDPHPEIPPSWLTLVWTSQLQALNFATESLTRAEWNFITCFTQSLVEINLEALNAEDINGAVLFPHLEKLNFVGGSGTAMKVLQSLQKSPLRHISLHIIDITTILCDESIFSKETGVLRPFLATLETFNLSSYACEKQDSSERISIISSQLGIPPGEKPPVCDHLSFYRTGTPYLGQNLLADNQPPHANSPATSHESALAVLHRAERLLDTAHTVGDDTYVDQISFALQTLTALTMLKED